MQSGDMKIAKLAAALEELNRAMEETHTLQVKLVLSKEEHEKLTTFQGDEFREFLHRATRAFLSGKEGEEIPPASISKTAERTKTVVICKKCQTPIEIKAKERPIEVECPRCGTSWRLK